MEATEAVAPLRAGRISRASTDHRRRDQNFFLLMVALLWLGLLMGFAPEIAGRIQAHKPFPAVVYFHGAVFCSWLCLLTAQVLLIRSRRVDLHRELGMAGAALYGAMLVPGIVTSVVVDYAQFATPQSDPSFFSIQLADMLAFAVLGGAAIGLRKSADAHKRLIILATICISNAGFSRWWGPGLEVTDATPERPAAARHHSVCERVEAAVARPSAADHNRSHGSPTSTATKRTIIRRKYAR